VLLVSIGAFTALVPMRGRADRDPNMVYIDELMTLPEDKIDIGLVALNLEKEFNPDLDVAAYSRIIDDLARQVVDAVNGLRGIVTWAKVMEVVLFLNGNYRYDLTGIAQDRNEPFLLSHLLDTKRGYCFTLPMLYMAVAQRAGFP